MLDVGLVVEGLTEPVSEVTAGGDTVRIVGGECRRSLVGPRDPKLVAICEEGDVENRVRRDRREGAGLARTREARAIPTRSLPEPEQCPDLQRALSTPASIFNP